MAPIPRWAIARWGTSELAINLRAKIHPLPITAASEHELCAWRGSSFAYAEV